MACYYFENPGAINRSLCTALFILLTLVIDICKAQGEFQFLGFAQLTAEHFDNDDRLDLGADRIRLSGTYSLEKISTRMILDLNAKDPDASPPGTLANVIQDLWINYQISQKHAVRAGQFKTPIGLDYNVPGSSLDITKRGMEKGLVFERDIGLMLSGRRLGDWFGYDVGVFNIAGRSAATRHTDDQAGDAAAWSGRVLFDYGPWHAQASLGVSEEAGGVNTRDYTVYDVAGSFKQGPWSLVVEWIDGSNVRGETDRDERVVYAHMGYRMTPRVEVVARVYDGKSNIAGQKTTLDNAYLGANISVFEYEKATGRLQLNYMLAGGDMPAYTGVSGFRSDAILVQFQWLVTN